jgi:hypothetical protein
MHKISTVAFALALSVAGSNVAKADQQPGADWMPLQQVVEQVLKSGYTQVTKVEAEDGNWEGKGVKNGQKMEFKADPKTGVITSEKQDNRSERWGGLNRAASFVFRLAQAAHGW